MPEQLCQRLTEDVEPASKVNRRPVRIGNPHAAVHYVVPWARGLVRLDFGDESGVVVRNGAFKPPFNEALSVRPCGWNMKGH